MNSFSQSFSYSVTIVFLALSLLVLPATSLPAAEAQAQRPEIVFYNWTAYVDEDVVREFEEAHNCTVKQVYYQSMDDRDERLVRNKGKGFDVITLGGSDIADYAEQGWILPLGPERIPNLKLLNPRWLNAWPKADAYAVPYLWGTSGIIYRADKVQGEITSWKQFYQPAEYLKGRIMLINMQRIGIGFGLKSLGYSYNSEDPEELAEVEALLLAQKPYVQTYGYLKTDAESGIVSGETWIGQTWNGDALLMQKREPAIRYVVPEEGGEIWVDFLTVARHSRHPELAMAFVNHLQDPQNNMRCALALEFASPNLETQKLLPEEFMNNPIIYPPEKALEHSEFQLAVSPRTQRRMATIWAKVVN